MTSFFEVWFGPFRLHGLVRGRSFSLWQSEGLLKDVRIGFLVSFAAPSLPWPQASLNMCAAHIALQDFKAGARSRAVEASGERAVPDQGCSPRL